MQDSTFTGLPLTPFGTFGNLRLPTVPPKLRSTIVVPITDAVRETDTKANVKVQFLKWPLKAGDISKSILTDVIYSFTAQTNTWELYVGFFFYIVYPLK